MILKLTQVKAELVNIYITLTNHTLVYKKLVFESKNLLKKNRYREY